MNLIKDTVIGSIFYFMFTFDEKPMIRELYYTSRGFIFIVSLGLVIIPKYSEDIKEEIKNEVF